MSDQSALSVAELRSTAGPLFGVFRAIQLQPAAGDTGVIEFQLADITGSIPAQMSPDCAGAESVAEFAPCYVTGQIQQSGASAYFEVNHLYRLTKEVPPIRLIPLDLCAPAAQTVLPEFVKWVSALENEHLEDFVCWVFNDPRICIPYFNIPSSKESHHNYPGGNAVHCVELIRLILAISPVLGFGKQTELALLGAAFHDVGKIVLADGKFRVKSVTHEQRALEILAPALARLEEGWFDASEFLRHILTYDWTQQPLQSPIAAAVHFADVLSAMTDAWKQAFDGAEYWKSLASLSTTYGRPRNYLRCPEPKVLH